MEEGRDKGEGKRLRVYERGGNGIIEAMRICVAWTGLGIVLLGSSRCWAQLGEEPVRKAEAVEEVRPAQKAVETVRKAEPLVKPRGDTGAPIDPSQPVVLQIESPKEDEVMPWETVDVFIKVQNYALAEDGNRIHLILDNGSPIEHTSDRKPVVLRGLTPGAHTLRVFAVKPDGQMLGGKAESARVNFFVRRKDFSNFQPWDHPYLLVNLPMDGLAYPDAEGRVWFDFQAINATIKKDGYRVRLKMNGVETILATGAPYPWAGLGEGRYRVVVELIDEDGDVVSEMYARAERTFEVPRVVKAVTPNAVDSANLWLKKNSR